MQLKILAVRGRTVITQSKSKKAKKGIAKISVLINRAIAVSLKYSNFRQISSRILIKMEFTIKLYTLLHHTKNIFKDLNVLFIFTLKAKSFPISFDVQQQFNAYKVLKSR